MSTGAVSDKNAQYFQALVPADAEEAKQLNHFKNFTNSSSYTATLEAETTLVSLFATQDCWCRFVPSTESDTAAAPSESVKTNCFFVPGGIAAFFGVPRKEDVRYKIAVVRDSANGILYVAEGA